MQFAVTNSTVSSGDRLIEMEAGNSPGFFTFYSAADGTGYLAEGSFQEKDMKHSSSWQMASYDLRFTIRKVILNLRLLPPLVQQVSPANACGAMNHRRKRYLPVTEDVPGYMTSQQFKDRITLTNEEITAIRRCIVDRLSFCK
jgi:hypothetical protein